MSQRQITPPKPSTPNAGTGANLNELYAQRGRAGSSVSTFLTVMDPDFRGKQGNYESEDSGTENQVRVFCSCGDRFVLRRKNPGRVVWNIIVFLLLIYMATIFLYRFCFFSFHITPDGIDPIGEDDLGWKVVNTVVDVLFWIDLVFSFFLSYEDSQGNEVVAFYLIAKKYLGFVFWINLLACLPEPLVEAFFKAIISDDSGSGVGSVEDFSIARVYRLQRISRLARLVRLTRLLKLVNFKVHNAHWDWFKTLRGVRIINFLVGLVWACHLLACGWYLTAALHNDVTVTWVGRRTVIAGGEERTLLQQGAFEQWLVSMYFVLTVFTTVGFGDISAGTEGEILYVVLTMICGAVVHSIIISEVIGVVTSTDKKQEFIEEQMNVLDQFAQHVQLDPDLHQVMRDEIQKRARNSNTLDRDFDKDSMKQLLLGKYMPRYLVGVLPMGLFRGQLMQNKFLQCCTAVCVVPPRLPMLLAISLNPAEFLSGEIVYQMHDFAFNVFLVQKGTFATVGIPSPEGGSDCMVQDWVAVAAREQEMQAAHAKRQSLEATQAPEMAARGSSRSLLHTTTMQGLTSMSVSAHGVKDSIVKRMSLAVGGRPTEPFENRMSDMFPGDVSATLFPYRLFGHGSYFGELECILGKGRVSTIRCETHEGTIGEVLILKKRDFSDLVNEFPQFGEAWASAAWRREAMRLESLRKLTEKRNCRHMAAIQIQQAFKHWTNHPRKHSRSGSGVNVDTPVFTRPLVGAVAHRVKDLRNIAVDKDSSKTILNEIQAINRRLDTLQSLIEDRTSGIGTTPQHSV